MMEGGKKQHTNSDDGDCSMCFLFSCLNIEMDINDHQLWCADRLSNQNSRESGIRAARAQQPKQSVPTDCCLKVSPYTCVYKHSNARIRVGFEGTGTNGFGALHHAWKSNHRHSCHIKQEKVHFIASNVSKKIKKEEGRVNKPGVPQPPQNSSFIQKKNPEP